MGWRLVAIVGLASASAACPRKSEGTAHQAVPPAPGASSATSPANEPTGGAQALFSRPIAAAHLGDGATIALGLVVGSSSIDAERIEADGTTGAANPVLLGVSWGTGVELKALPSPSGATAVWRGLRSGKTATQAVRVGSDAAPRGAPFDIGSADCATDDGQAWLDQGAHGATRVRTWAWDAPAALDVLTLPSDRDPELVCGAHRLFALGGGEDDVTAVRALAAEAGAPVVLLRARDFPHEDEREHDAYTVGDTLGIVRMGDSGALALREWGSDGLGPWRVLRTKLAPDDDIVAVDADANSVVIVVTHEAGDGCGEGGATTVRAVQVRRASPDASAPETELDLAGPLCDRDPGPFWTGVVSQGVIVGWAERGHAAPARTGGGAPERDGAATEAGSGRPVPPPISGFSHALVLDGAGEGAAGPRATHVEVAADEIVSAGCDKQRCYAAALVRPPGEDGMKPEAIRVLAYP